MKRKIKIIHIIPSLDIGGAERLLADIAVGINKDSFEVKIFCLKKMGHFAQVIDEQGIPIIFIGQKPIPLFLKFFKIYSVLKEEKPDIVHTHLFGADFYGRLAAKLAKIKIIVSTEHNINISEKGVRRFLKRLTTRLANKIIAVSGAVGDYAIKKEGATKEQIQVIHNGVSSEDFFNGYRDYSDKETFIIGFVGRLSKQKGVDVLIKAVPLIKNKVKCLIAGDGELKNSLIKQIASNKLEDRIQLVGESKDVSSFLKTLDIFVVPSKWEGFGIVLVEAGMSGLPSVVSNVDGLREIIEHKENGLVFKSKNSKELAEKIDYFCDNPDERRQLGIALQNKCMEKFEIKTIIKKYEDLYKELIG